MWNLTLLVVLVFGTLSMAQTPPAPLPLGGTEVITQPLRGFVNAGKATVTPDNTGGWDIVVTERAPQPWDVGIAQAATPAIAAGDVLAIEFIASGKGALTSEAFINVVFEESQAPHSKSLDMSFSAGAEERRWVFPFIAEKAYPAGGSQLSIRFGDTLQTVRIHSIRVVNYGKSVKLADLPNTPLTYPGMEDDAPWRKEALARIDKIRKGDLEVRVVDAAGKPVTGAQVRVEMTRHAYLFGTCVPANRLTEKSAEMARFREILKSHFNYATIENHLKWSLYISDKTTGPAAVDWLGDNGFSVRGHNLIWPGMRNNHFIPAQISSEFNARKERDPAAARAWLKETCESHVLDLSKRLAGKVRDWDVINEPYANHDVMDELGNSVMVDWFKLAHQGDPAAKLFINDYGILEGAGRDTRHIDGYFDQIKFLKESGAPIHGIGIQGHWGGTLTDPVTMLAILDRFATFGLEIQITEFDINITDEQTQAAFTRDALITVFSHPSTTAFIKWGFWERAHWLPRGAMFRADFTAKPNAAMWEEWVLNKWWTRESVTTSPTGTASLRGFKGNYNLTVTHNGQTATTQTTIGDKPTGVTVKLP
jgi:endo-1,4-beta-xylanase